MPSTEYSWMVLVDHPAFAGHFPGHPIVPGVVLLDRALGFAEQWIATPGAYWHVGQAKFLSPVGPGTLLRFVLVQGASGALTFTVDADGRLVARGNLTPVSASLTPASPGQAAVGP
jgi:3-hydroxymyristoyl/3-hydroxydecanoyl-(acyl carrier protein) dehydratase